MLINKHLQGEILMGGNALFCPAIGLNWKAKGASMIVKARLNGKNIGKNVLYIKKIFTFALSLQNQYKRPFILKALKKTKRFGKVFLTELIMY
ncbi:MAG: hypothetical protein LBH04_11655 [Tannerellaceae bacterium]|jgi:hypothetical protein|nr:hypothetical protein [Tannerellaceae bacterium]